jgi:hypothetical protein
VVAGVVLLVMGIAGLGQAAAAFSAGALGWPMAKVWGFTGALGRQNAVRHPGRTAASAAAVVVGVALICALAVIASSARASSNDELNRTVLADYVLTAAGAGPSGGGPAVVPPMAPGVVARLRAEPGVGVVSPSSYLTFSVDGRGSDWGATIDLSTYSRVVGLGPLQGSLAGLRTGGVAVEKSLAAARGWHLGQVLPFTFFPQDGSAEVTSSFPISAMFDSEGYYGGFLFSAATLASTYPKLQPSLVFVNGAPGTTPSATRLAVARALAGYPEVSVADPAEVQATQDQVIDRQIDLAAVLSLLALIIGYLGIVTNLTLSITERVRELGLLRALGMSSRQVGAAVRFESAIIAALGALVGTALGLFVGWPSNARSPPTASPCWPSPGELLPPMWRWRWSSEWRPGSYPPAGPVGSPCSRRSPRSDQRRHDSLNLTPPSQSGTGALPEISRSLLLSSATLSLSYQMSYSSCRRLPSGVFVNRHRRSSGRHRPCCIVPFVPLKRTDNAEVASSILASPTNPSLVRGPVSAITAPRSRMHRPGAPLSDHRLR